jgi:hypothetical protein
MFDNASNSREVRRTSFHRHLAFAKTKQATIQKVMFQCNLLMAMNALHKNYLRQHYDHISSFIFRNHSGKQTYQNAVNVCNLAATYRRFGWTTCLHSYPQDGCSVLLLQTDLHTRRRNIAEDSNYHIHIPKNLQFHTKRILFSEPPAQDFHHAMNKTSFRFFRSHYANVNTLVPYHARPTIFSTYTYNKLNKGRSLLSSGNRVLYLDAVENIRSAQNRNNNKTSPPCVKNFFKVTQSS